MGVEINVREAIIFVYKKTVFEISTDIKKRSFVTAEQNVYFGILNESLSFMNQLSKFRKEHDCLDDYARKISFQNELTDTRMSRLYFLNSLVSGLSILKTSDINFFNVIDAVFKKMKKSSNKNEFVFSMEKLTNAIDNDFSPLKIANQLLLT
jgi:MFS superfamily sulfate permease-like transporter